jgi:hypothetical protein
MRKQEEEEEETGEGESWCRIKSSKRDVASDPRTRQEKRQSRLKTRRRESEREREMQRWSGVNGPSRTHDRESWSNTTARVCVKNLREPGCVRVWRVPRWGTTRTPCWHRRTGTYFTTNPSGEATTSRGVSGPGRAHKLLFSSGFESLAKFCLVLPKVPT